MPENQSQLAQREFATIWNEWIEHTAHQAPKHQRKSAETSLRKTFAEMRSIQLGIMHRLIDCLAETGERELVDIMGGKAMATIPLVRAGILDSLQIIDCGKSASELQSGKTAARGNTGKISFLNLALDKKTPPDAMPAAKTMVLSETGLGLPPNNRLPQHWNPGRFLSSQDFRSAHILNPNLSLADIIKILGTRERTLHVMDTPFFLKQLAPEQIAEYIKSQAQEVGGWEISEPSQIGELGTTHVILRR